MGFTLTDEGIVLDEPVYLPPRPARRAHATSALDQADPLFSYLSTAVDRVAHFCDPAIEHSAEGQAAQEAFATLARAHALDLYADAGDNAQAWPRTVVEAIYLLRMLAHDHAPSMAPRCWSLQAPRFALVVSPIAPHARPAAGLRIDAHAPGMSLRTLSMDEVAQAIGQRPARQVWHDALRVRAVMPRADFVALTIATGALTALIMAPVLTGYGRLAMVDPVQGWHAQITGLCLRCMLVEPSSG